MYVVDQDQLGAHLAQQLAYGVGDLDLVHPLQHRQAEEAGELADEHLRGGGRRHGDEQDRQTPVLVRVAAPVGELVFSVVAGPEMIRPRLAPPCWPRLSSCRRRTAVEMVSMAGVLSTTKRAWYSSRCSSAL